MCIYVYIWCVNMRNSWLCAVCVLCVLVDLCAAQETCYPPGGVAGIVVATIIVTFVVGGLGAAVAYKLWTRKKGPKGRDRVDGQHPKQSQKPNEFAFDNPYFRDPEANDGDHAEKGKERSSMNNKNSLRSSKLSELSSKGKKPRSGKNHFMFGGGGGKKHRALDDSCLSVEPERTVVSLRGHDFTGLGFNICGNMRDGILVKDVLHRGPASESGLIKAGDKIVNVTVSFTNIVYEDALTILSYASPYDVQLEIERVPEKSRPDTPPGSKRLGSCSFNNSGQKLFHPLYRSQSIDDLTQIDKDTFPSHGAGPRRSQSVGVAAHKLAAHFKSSDTKLEDNKERGSGALMLSTTGSLNEKMLANVMADGHAHKNGLQWEKRFEDTLESEDSNNDAQTIGGDSSKKSSGILKTSKVSDDPASNFKQNTKYLDSPHQRGKLETFKSSDGRAKTLAEASSALWHLDQSIKEGDASATEFEGSRNQPKRDDIASKNNKFAKREEDNDSDVSNDSLELSSKKRGNKKGKRAPDILKDEERKGSDPKCGHKQGHQQKSSKKEIRAKGRTEISNHSERVYANNILNKSVSSLHNISASPSDESRQQGSDRGSHQESNHREQSSAYANHRDLQEDRNTQKILVQDSSSHYGKANSYGERQKLASPDNYPQTYGCTVTINGESDEHKSKFSSTPKAGLVQKNTGYLAQDEISRNDADSRYLDKNKSNAKFVKKSTHPAGMFTQINPFQQPSRQKNAHFKVWTGREDSNGGENNFSVNSPYISCDSSHSNRRDYLAESQSYAPKTVLISSYDGRPVGGAQGRTQHK